MKYYQNLENSKTVAPLLNFYNELKSSYSRAVSTELGRLGPISSVLGYHTNGVKSDLHGDGMGLSIDGTEGGDLHISESDLNPNPEVTLPFAVLDPNSFYNSRSLVRSGFTNFGDPLNLYSNRLSVRKRLGVFKDADPQSISKGPIADIVSFEHNKSSRDFSTSLLEDSIDFTLRKTLFRGDLSTSR